MDTDPVSQSRTSSNGSYELMEESNTDGFLEVCGREFLNLMLEMDAERRAIIPEILSQRWWSEYQEESPYPCKCGRN